MSKYNNKSKNNRKGGSFRKERKDQRCGNRNDNRNDPMDRKGNLDWNNHHSNDPAWWNQVGSVMDAASRIPFNRLAGYSYNIDSGMYLTFGDGADTVEMSVPTMMTIDYVPGVGVSKEYSDAPNRAFQAIYSYIYSKTTGAIQFPQYAVALTQIATASIAQNIAVVKRALGVAQIYSAANKAYPREILRAMGFDPDDVIDNLAILRSRINNIILDFNTLPLISSNKVFQRQYALANSIYLDNNTIGSQMYILRPAVAYLYSDLGRLDDGNYDGKACCMPAIMPYFDVGSDNALSPKLTTLDTIMDLINLQIKSIRNSADFALVSGSIMRAYESAAFVRIDPVTADYVQTLTAEDQYMLYQIHNMNIPGRITASTYSDPRFPGVTKFYGAGSCDITGDPVTNQLKYTPIIMGQGNFGDFGSFAMATGNDDCDFILNTFENSVDTNWIIEATRLMSAWTSSVGTPILRAQTLSTEFVAGARIWVPNGDVSVSIELTPILLNIIKNEDGVVTHNIADVNKIRNALDKFHKAPHFYSGLCVITKTNNIENRAFTFGNNSVTGDLHYWSTISAEQLQLLNVPALLSIFGITG